MKLPLIGFLSWFAGLLAYPAACFIFYRQTMSFSGDFFAAAFQSFFVYHTSFLLLYIPCLIGLHRILRGYRPRFIFALVPALLCFVPTFLVMAMFGGFQLRLLFTHEARLFHCFFAVSGAVAGLCFTYEPNTRNA